MQRQYRPAQGVPDLTQWDRHVLHLYRTGHSGGVGRYRRQRAARKHGGAGTKAPGSTIEACVSTGVGIVSLSGP
eukprot:768131-Rhodomonas_salina.3